MAPCIAMSMPEGVPRLGRSPVQASILAPVDSHSVHPTGPAREGAQNITHSRSYLTRAIGCARTLARIAARWLMQISGAYRWLG